MRRLALLAVLVPALLALGTPGVEAQRVSGDRAVRWGAVEKQRPTRSVEQWTDAEGRRAGSRYLGHLSTERLFFEFETPFLKDAVVTQAQLGIRLQKSATCTPQATRVYSTSSWAEGLSWRTQPALRVLQGTASTAAGHPACAPNGILEEWDVTQAARAAAASDSPTMALALLAQDEANPGGWKSYRHTAFLRVSYDHRPSDPTELTVDGFPCDDVLGRTASPVRPRVRVEDPDGDAVEATFRVTRKGDKKSTVLRGGPIVSPGVVVGSGFGPLRPGEVYTIQARAVDADGLRSRGTVSCTFRVQ